MIKRKVFSSETSLLSKEESTVFKGLLILLIIVGHNQFFTTHTQGYNIMGYLYCFHIEAFFILPFLYGAKKLSKKRILDGLIKLYYPYILFCLILYVGYYVIYQKHSFNFLEYLNIIIFTNGVSLQKYTGVQILWFLPAMFTLSIIKDFYYQSTNTTKILLLLISFVCLILSLLSLDWGKYHAIVSSISIIIPFGIFSAFSFLIWGVLIRNLLHIKKPQFLLYLNISLWIIGTIIYFINETHWHLLGIIISLRLIFPVLFFLIYYELRSYINFKLFHNLGNQSFKIYIFHPFLGYILFFLIPDFLSYHTFTKWLIIISAITLVTLVSYLFAIFIKKIKILDKFLFPQKYKDLVFNSHKINFK